MASLKIKSKFEAEFRRVSFPMTDVDTYEHFKTQIERLHKLNETPFVLSYANPTDGRLLPIDDDDHLRRAVLTADPLLRIVIQRKRKSKHDLNLCGNSLRTDVRYTCTDVKHGTIACPSGAACSAGGRRLRFLAAFKRCDLCRKRNPFKRVVECRDCKTVYHRGCGERALTAAVPVPVPVPVPVEDDRDVLVEEPENPADPTAGRQRPTTVDRQPVPARVSPIGHADDRDPLAADTRRRRAVHAAEGRRRRAERLPATAVPANPETRTAAARGEGDRDPLAADRRRRAVQAAERRQRAATDRLIGRR